MTKIISRKTRILEAHSTVYESPRGINGITYAVRNVGRKRGKNLHGLMVSQLSNGRFVEAPFSTGRSAILATQQAIKDSAAVWLTRAQAAGVCGPNDTIVHIDCVCADDSLNNDDLKEVKFVYSAGYTNVYGKTGKHGN